MFQKSVATVAIVILIITLCFIGIALYNQAKNANYPPAIANCPDYWDVSGNMCVNSMALGNDTCHRPMNFTTPQWNNSSAMCRKYTWAQSCNLTWDGISDNASLCG
jgi:hypothetical protein